MNYREFALKILSEFTIEQQLQTVTLFEPDTCGDGEYFPAYIAFTDEDCDVLDPGHAVLVPQ